MSVQIKRPWGYWPMRLALWLCHKIGWLFPVLVISLFAAPPNELKLIWDTYPTTYIGTNDTGATFTNTLTGYKLYWSPRIDIPVASWNQYATYAPGVTYIQVPFIEGMQFFALTGLWTTNGGTAYFFVEGETRPSNVTGALLPPSGKNLKAARP